MATNNENEGKEGGGKKRLYKIPVPPGFVQFQIGKGGEISRPKNRMLFQIDTLEFRNWQYQCNKDSLNTWVDVIGFKWLCFGCNATAFKHAPFCHHSCSYTKREGERNEGKDLNKTVEKFISRNDLVFLSTDETRFNNRKRTNFSMFREQLEKYDLHNQTRTTSHAEATAAEKLLMLKNPSMPQLDSIVEHDDMEDNMEGNVTIIEEMVVTEDMEDKVEENVVVTQDNDDNDVSGEQLNRKTGTISHIGKVSQENIEDNEDKDDSPQSCKRNTATLRIDDGITKDMDESPQVRKRRTATLRIDECTGDGCTGDDIDKVFVHRKSKRKTVSSLRIEANNAEVMLDNGKDVSPRNILSPRKNKKKFATLRIDEGNTANNNDVSIRKSNRKKGKTGKDIEDKDNDSSSQKLKRKKTTLPIDGRYGEDMEDRDSSLQESNRRKSTVQMDEGAKKRISKGNIMAMSAVLHVSPSP